MKPLSSAPWSQNFVTAILLWQICLFNQNQKNAQVIIGSLPSRQYYSGYDKMTNERHRVNEDLWLGWHFAEDELSIELVFSNRFFPSPVITSKARKIAVSDHRAATNGNSKPALVTALLTSAGETLSMQMASFKSAKRNRICESRSLWLAAKNVANERITVAETSANGFDVP